LIYGMKGQNISFATTQVPGKILMYLNQSDNLFVKQQLIPRTNLYYIELFTPAIQNCYSLTTNFTQTYIVPYDKVSPNEFIGNGDLQAFDNQMTTIYWD